MVAGRQLTPWKSGQRLKRRQNYLTEKSVVVSGVTQLKSGDDVEITLADGQRPATID
jgi:hypothetical protein